MRAVGFVQRESRQRRSQFKMQSPYATRKLLSSAHCQCPYGAQYFHGRRQQRERDAMANAFRNAWLLD
jgi:hypothetical protein